MKVVTEEPNRDGTGFSIARSAQSENAGGGTGPENGQPKMVGWAQGLPLDGADALGNFCKQRGLAEPLQSLILLLGGQDRRTVFQPCKETTLASKSGRAVDGQGTEGKVPGKNTGPSR